MRLINSLVLNFSPTDRAIAPADMKQIRLNPTGMKTVPLGTATNSPFYQLIYLQYMCIYFRIYLRRSRRHNLAIFNIERAKTKAAAIRYDSIYMPRCNYCRFSQSFDSFGPYLIAIGLFPTFGLFCPLPLRDDGNNDLIYPAIKYNKIWSKVKV